MRQILAVASREFVERKLVVAAGAVLAGLTLFTPLLPGIVGFTKGDVIGAAAAWVSMVILFVGALVMGMTSINGDLSERRLAFYFSRPMSGSSIWLGKVVGALAVVIVTAAVALLPAAVVGFRSTGEIESSDISIFAWAVVGLFFFGHVTACFARVRSIWIILDFVGIFVLGAGIVTAFDAFFRLVPIDHFGQFIITAGARSFQVFVGIAIVASAAGIILGRVEPSRVHRWTSIILWSLVAAALVGVWIAAIWLGGATPSDIRAGTRMAYAEGGGGEWLGVSGNARAGLYQEFLMNPDGRYLAVGSKFGLMASTSRLVAIEPDPAHRLDPNKWRRLDGTIVLADLDGDLEWRRTKIDVEDANVWGLQPALSSDGTRLAIPSESGLAIYSLPDETMLRAVALDLSDTGGYSSLLFVEADRLRVVRTMRSSGFDEDRNPVSLTTVVDIIVSSGRQEQRVAFEASSFAVDPSGRFILTRVGSERRVLDVETGLTTGTFEARANVASIRWLSDGSVAISDDVPGGGRVLRIVTREGAEVRRVEIPDVEMLRLGYEPRAGALMATAASIGPEHCSERRLVEIDLESGTSREVARGLTTLWSWKSNVPQGSPASRTFLGCDGRIVRYDGDLVHPETILE